MCKIAQPDPYNHAVTTMVSALPVLACKGSQLSIWLLLTNNHHLHGDITPPALTARLQAAGRSTDLEVYTYIHPTNSQQLPLTCPQLVLLNGFQQDILPHPCAGLTLG